MTRTQWIVMGFCFLFGAYMFGNYYADIWMKSGIATDISEMYSAFGSFSLFLAIISFIMGWLEPKKIKERKY